MTNRRQLLITLGAGALAAPLVSFAQQPAKVPRIGLLVPSSATTYASRIGAFRQGLRDLGYVEERNIVIEYRYSEASMDRLPDLAAELVRLKVGVIITASAQAVRAAKQATTTIPIVIAQVSDPVALGFATSLARPGGNITGLSTFLPEFNAKALELLRETFPSVTRVAFLSDPTDPSYRLVLKEIEAAARALGIELQLVEAREANDLDHAFAVMTKKRAGAVEVMPTPMFSAHRTRIAKLAVNNRLPTIFSQSEYVEAGGLMSYGVNIADLWRRAATFVDKILKGRKPSDLPIEQPTKIELVINMKTAKALGLTIPQSVLVRADRVIE